LLKLIEGLEAEHPSRTIAVLIPEVVKRYWWQQLLQPTGRGGSPTRCSSMAARASPL
jgi:hypothetical protein